MTSAALGISGVGLPVGGAGSVGRIRGLLADLDEPAGWGERS